MINGNRPGLRDHFTETVGIMMLCFGVFVTGVWLGINYTFFIVVGVTCIILGVLLSLNYKVNKFAAKFLKKFLKKS